MNTKLTKQRPNEQTQLALACFYLLLIILTFLSFNLKSSLVWAKNFSVIGDATLSSNAYQLNDTKNSSDFNLMIRSIWKPRAEYNPYGISHKLKLELSKSLSDEYSSTTIEDGYYGLSKILLDKADTITISMEGRLSIPLSDKSRYRDTLITKTYLAPRMDLRYFHPFLKQLEFTYIPAVSKNFHKFTTGRDGKLNTSYDLNNYIGLSESPIEPLSFSVSLTIINSWDYENNPKKTIYYLEQEASYAFPKSGLTAAIGHSNLDQIYKYNGVDAERMHLQVHDVDTSSFYVRLTKIF